MLVMVLALALLLRLEASSVRPVRREGADLITGGYQCHG